MDNVDVDAATKRGIIVMNTPGGNTISTAEHAFSLMVSLARNIPQADASVKSGKWDRKTFLGVELYNKTLAILGMGRIGTEFARRAIAFGMRVLAYDPYLSAAGRARSLQVELLDSLDDIVPQADFITLHMPLTPETKYMLNAERLAKTRRGVRIVNCARGGLIEETALVEALKSRARWPPRRSTFSKQSRFRRILRCVAFRTSYSLRTWAPPPRKRRKASASRWPSRFAQP